jgi:hypothetical protein
MTFKTWRVIFYLQTALAGTALGGAYLLLPETIHRKKSDELVGLPLKRKALVLWGMINPWRVILLYKYPNLIVVALASSSLVWNMCKSSFHTNLLYLKIRAGSYLRSVYSSFIFSFWPLEQLPSLLLLQQLYHAIVLICWTDSLLTPIRYVLNPRFHLDSPLLSGLFYLAPGCGYLLGTFLGGRYADFITIKWQKKRNGTRVPEDRLRVRLDLILKCYLSLRALELRSSLIVPV